MSFPALSPRPVSFSAVALALALGLAATCGAQTSAAPADERLTRLEKLLETTRAELAAVRSAQAPASGGEARLAELDRKIEILAREIEGLRLGDAAAPADARSEPGLGVAASRIYGVKRGVSIGGYGELLYQNVSSTRQDGSPSGANDTIDLSRVVLYLGYKFDDRFLLNTEIEYAHAVTASDKGGEVEVEFAYLDFRSDRRFNLRAGLLLVPMGLVNERHEPPTYLGARRPDVETYLIPSTFRELGLGAYGDLGPVTYRAYVVNGLDAVGYTGAEGIREGRQEGSEALARNLAFTTRVDVTALPGAVLGASLFTGNAGQGRATPGGETLRARTTILDLHAEWRYRGLQLRGLFVRTTVAEAEQVNLVNGLHGDESVGSRQQGWYLEAGYDILSGRPGGRAALVPFLRYEEYDTQAEVPAGYERSPANDVKLLTLGLAFKPIDQIVLKLDWQGRRNRAETGVNQVNVGLGYLF